MDKEKNDHLGDFIKESENVEKQQPTQNDNVEYFGNNKKEKVDKIEIDDWINLPIKTLPYNKFYKTGTKIFMKPLTTKEKQAFAAVNENNPLDVSVKLNEVFQACIKFVHANGELGSYRDIIDGDKQTTALTLAKLSAKNGRKFEHKVKSKNGEEVTIEMIPANYVYVETDELESFFNKESKVYELKNPSNGDTIKLAPPTIGLTEDFNTWLFKKSAESNGQDLPTVSFITCILYMQAGKGIKNIDTEKFDQLEYDFSKINGDRFEVIIDTVENYIDFGIKKIKAQSSTGEWVEAPFRYPGGARNLFIIPNALKAFIGQ